MKPKNLNMFGRRIALDDRDRSHLLERYRKLRVASLPTNKLWTISSEHMDQGSTGTCVGHGWRNFLRCAPLRTSAVSPSAWDIYRKAVLLDPWKDNNDEAKLPDFDAGLDSGTTVRAGAKAMMNMRRLTSYGWAFSLQPAVEWVLTRGPLVLGVNWYDSMFEASSKGVIAISPAAVNVGGHCLLLRGVNTSTGQGLLTNSWGNAWAKKGDALISLGDLERLILENGEVCTAIQSD